MYLFLEYSRIALRKESKRGRGMERTQPMIYGPLLFGGYLARVAVLIEHVGLGLHQGFLTLRVLNLSTFTTENQIRVMQSHL